MQQIERPILQETARIHRKEGKPFSKIADIMGLTKGHVWSLLTERVPAQKPPKPNENIVVKRRTHHGTCSTTCRDVFIAMPRIPTLDGPFLGDVAATATVH